MSCIVANKTDKSKARIKWGFYFFTIFSILIHMLQMMCYFFLELHATVFSVSVKHTGITGRDFRLLPRRN